MISDARRLGIMSGGIFVVAVIFAMCIFAVKDKEKKFRSEAVERGFAAWKIGTNGEVFFTWKEMAE